MKRKQSSKRQLSVRRVSAQLSLRLDRLRKKRGLSLNQTVLELLEHAVGLHATAWTDRYTTGSPSEVEALAKAVAGARKVDPKDWT